MIGFCSSKPRTKIELSGPPDTLVITGKSTRSGSWESVPLSKIFADVAARNGWQTVCRMQTKVPRADRLSESDFNFIIRLAKQYDCMAKVADGKLLVMPRQAGQSASGESFGVVLIQRRDVSRFQFRLGDRNTHKAVPTMAGTRFNNVHSVAISDHLHCVFHPPVQDWQPMWIIFFDGTDRIELGCRYSFAGGQSMPQDRSRAARINLRESWQAESFLRRHLTVIGEMHRLRALLSAQVPLVHLLDDDEVLRQVSGKLSSGEFCAYVYPNQRPILVRMPAPVVLEEVVAPVPAAARKRLPAKAPSKLANRLAPVVLTFVEIELLDMQGRPVAGEPYIIALPNGRQHCDVLDERGRARVDGLDPGNCQVIFPELDRRVVERWKGS